MPPKGQKAKQPRSHFPSEVKAKPAPKEPAPEFAVPQKASTHVLSMDAIRLLRDIQEKRLDAADLNAQQRRACLMVMANGKQSLTEIAHILKVDRACITKDMRKIREKLGKEVRGYTLDSVLGQLAHCAEKFTAKAMAQEDTGLAWSIQKDFVRTLKELGVLNGQGQQEGLRVTIEAMGSGYERARAALADALDPALTGEVIDVDAIGSRTLVDKSQDTAKEPEGIDLPSVRPDAPGEQTDEVVVVPLGKERAPMDVVRSRVRALTRPKDDEADSEDEE